MPRNGAGQYTLPSGNPVVSGQLISSSVQNNTMNDVAAALSASIANDGQTSIIANIPLNGFKITGAGDGTASGDYTTVRQLTNSGPDLIGVAWTVSSMAALRLLKITGSGKALVTGYYQASDGGGGVYSYIASDTTSGAFFTASASGTTLTVSAVANGTLAVGQVVCRSDTGAPVAYISALGTGAGGTGTYTLSASATIGSMTMMADNGGTIIVAADGGRWYLNSTGLINVRQFGAKGNGVFDDTLYLQSAITYAGSYSSGATVYFPTGKYLISSTINIVNGYVKLLGANMYGINNSPQIIGSGLYTATSGIGDMIKVNAASGGIYGVNIESLTCSAASGLASPPNGIHFKDASECQINDFLAGGGLSSGILFNGVDIMSVGGFTTSNNNANGIRFTINGTSVFVSNDTVWMKNMNIYNTSNAAVLIDSFTNDIKIENSYAEYTPYGVLMQPLTSMTVDGISLSDFYVFNGSSTPHPGAKFLSAIAPSGSLNYLRVQNLSVNNCRSYQYSGTNHIELNQNSNSNAATGYFNIVVNGGEWYGASTSLVFSDATSATGNIGPGINAQSGYQTGANIPLRSGSGTNGWGTQESGTFTPTDASGASLSFSTTYGSYVRSGTICTATIQVSYPSTASGASALLGSLPFTSKSTPANVFGGFISYGTLGSQASPLIVSNSSQVGFWTNAGVAVTNADLSTKSLRLTLVYESL